MGECMRTSSQANSVCEVLFFSASIRFNAHNAGKNMSQIRTKKRKIECFICKVRHNCLRSSKHFNRETTRAVIVYFFNETVHGFNNIRNRRVETGCKK